MDNDQENPVVAKLPLPRLKANKTKVYFGIFDARDTSLVPLQIILFLLACLEAIKGLIYIIRPSETSIPHVYAHLGSYTLAYASALFVISFRPARARGLLILVSVAAIGFVATSIFDLIRGRADLAGEVQHITKLLPPFLVWVIASRVLVFSKPYKNAHKN